MLKTWSRPLPRCRSEPVLLIIIPKAFAAAWTDGWIMESWSWMGLGAEKEGKKGGGGGVSVVVVTTCCAGLLPAGVLVHFFQRPCPTLHKVLLEFCYTAHQVRSRKEDEQQQQQRRRRQQQQGKRGRRQRCETGQNVPRNGALLNISVKKYGRSRFESHMKAGNQTSSEAPHAQLPDKKNGGPLCLAIYGLWALAFHKAAHF